MKPSVKFLKVKVFLFSFIFLLITALIVFIIIQNNKFEIIYIPISEFYESLNIEDIMKLNNNDVSFDYYRRIDGNSQREGLIREIKGMFTTNIILTPEDAVRSLTSVRDIMGIGSFSYTYNDGNVNHIHLNMFYLQQMYENIEVLNGQFQVYATNEGVPHRILGTYVNVGNLNTSPTVSSWKARRTFESIKYEGRLKAKLVIYEVGEDDIRLCWHFENFHRMILVDAHSGDLLLERKLNWV